MWVLHFNDIKVESTDLHLLFKTARLFFENRKSAHYTLFITKKGKKKKLVNYSCPCHRGMRTKLPLFDYYQFIQTDEV